MIVNALLILRVNMVCVIQILINKNPNFVERMNSVGQLVKNHQTTKYPEYRDM
jgi:hypothetical protein